MEFAVFYDCEFLSVKGAISRLWSGPVDPDPIIVQIGAVKLGLQEDYPVLNTFSEYVTPVGRNGKRIALDEYLVSLTGITEARIDEAGIPLEHALNRLNRFSEGSLLWSWGKDEIYMMAVSCYLANIRPNIAATRFRNAMSLFIRAGYSTEDIEGVSSSGLCRMLNLATGHLSAHDAKDDALSIAVAVRHLLISGQLGPSAFNGAA